MKKKVLLVFGTRPEAIKMAPLCHAFFEKQETLEIFICVTAQHREMLDQVLSLFSIVPNFDLDLMKPGQDLFDVTANVLTGLKKVFHDVQPDLVLVHGDTSTTFSTSLAAFYAGIPIGHIEAGLRTHDISSPFPEEFNRQATGKLASLHFCPTQQSEQNLINEGVEASKIHVTGNTVIDALHWVIHRIEVDPSLKSSIVNLLSESLNFKWQTSRYVLITGHRRENFGNGFVNICEAIRGLAKKFPKTHFVYPVHLNPNVQQPVMSIVGRLENVHLIPPLAYEPFVYLLNSSYIVLTDSGGIQEEAPSLGKPVLVMRETTERPEAVESGNVILVGADKEKIIFHTEHLLNNEDTYQKMSLAINPYGDGQSSIIILEKIKEFFHDDI
jgi:UDP-N-acetylglucosamine 2-epimerase (non-hydrolysing)